jgi:hypothetical protein
MFVKGIMNVKTPTLFEGTLFSQSIASSSTDPKHLVIESSAYKTGVPMASDSEFLIKSGDSFISIGKKTESI